MRDVVLIGDLNAETRSCDLFSGTVFRDTHRPMWKLNKTEMTRSAEI
jgi:hypothetical protein